MKTRYYTPETLLPTALSLLKSIQATKSAFSADGKRPALLVLDLQDYFLQPESHAFIPSAPAILPGILSLTKIFVEYGWPAIFTQHLNDELDAGMMAIWWNDLIRPTNPLSRLHPGLPIDLGKVIPKSQYDAFFDTILEDFLHQEHVTDVIICGVMTHLCCETTARSAFMRGFETWFTVDGTATYNEEIHRASLLNLSHGFAHMVTIPDILGKLQ